MDNGFDRVGFTPDSVGQNDRNFLDSVDSQISHLSAASGNLECPELDTSELQWFEHIGSGHTCDVFRGTCRGRIVAIKQLLMPTGKVSDETLAREVAIMCLVRHPNIVRLHGVVTTVSPLQIVMEYCTGGSVFEILHRKPDFKPTWSQMLKMSMHVAVAMDYLHKFTPCIIHRDLKSLNMLLDQPICSARDTPVVKVADFGLARVLDTGEPLTLGVGTNRWMAPEMLSRQAYDEKVDVYSYAMVLYEITCRKIPFKKEEPMELRRMVLSGVRPNLGGMAPQCPPKMRNLITSCWANNPRQRPSFEEIVSIIRSVKNQSVVVSL